MTVRNYLNENLPERWIGRSGDEYSFLIKSVRSHQTCTRVISSDGDMWRD